MTDVTANRVTPNRVTATRRVEAPPSEVFAFLCNPGRHPDVDGSGMLIGVVSRRDLMKVFLRPDAEIEDEVRDVLNGILLADARGITVAVHEGVVVLTGVVTDKDMIPLATRLASDVPGVVAVANHLEAQAPKPPAEPRNPE